MAAQALVSETLASLRSCCCPRCSRRADSAGLVAGMAARCLCGWKRSVMMSLLILFSGRTLRRLFMASGLGLFMVAVSAPAVAADTDAPRLSSNSDIATAGFYRLSWLSSARRVELQEADSPAFANATTFYTGSDRATVISGRNDGTRYYRLRGLDGPGKGIWSQTVRVTVRHHTLGRALLFFTLGVIVFVATAAMIISRTGKHDVT